MKFKTISNDWIENLIDWDDVHTVADVSSFRPDAEQVRALKFNPQGSGSTPVYDYPDGKVPEDDPISDTIVALRSGRLDKADVERIREGILKDANSKADKEHADKLAKAVDKALGIETKSESK